MQKPSPDLVAHVLLMRDLIRANARVLAAYRQRSTVDGREWVATREVMAGLQR